MAFNGSGTFVRLYNWVQDAANNINIVPDRHDAEDDGFATGLSNCITKDGQTIPTANLPMNGFSHTDVGDGASIGEYPSINQLLDGQFSYLYTTGAANTYVVSPEVALPAYADGQEFSIKINTTNTGASTLNISGLGAKSLVMNVSTALPANALIAGTNYKIIYNGTSFQVKDPSVVQGKLVNHVHGTDVASASTVDLTNTTGNFIAITGTTTITTVTLPDGFERTVRFTGILTLTNGANLLLPGAANITTAAGDIAVFRGGASSVVYCTSYQRLASTITTLTPGTSANNIVQLNGSGALPAVSGANLTNISIAASQVTGLPLTTIFTSTAQTITDAGTITLTHGLGAIPKIAMATMTCTTNNLGYTAGQTFFINPCSDITNVSTGNSLVFTSTTVVVRFGSGGQEITNPTNGTGGAATSADFTMTFTFLA